MKITRCIFYIFIYWKFTACTYVKHTGRTNNQVLSDSIINRVPEECSDLKTVKIDKLVRETSNGSGVYYAIYGNYTHYVQIDGITDDHLPIVRSENQPKKYDHKAMLKLRHAQKVDQYTFEDNGYSYRNNNTIKFIGFNSVWLGCPQPLCLSGNIDAATRLPNGTVYVFRGNYYWDLKNLPTVNNAMKISRWKGNKTKITRFDYGYFNSVVTNLNYTSFYQGEFQYIWDNGLIIENPTRLVQSEFQYEMNAGFYVKNGTKYLTYSIKGEEAINDDQPFEVLNITNMGIPWNKVDAAFGQNNTIYIFKDWFYIKLAQNITVPAQPKLVFEDIFKCPRDFYDKFDGYETFKRKYLSLKASRRIKSRSNDDLKSVRINSIYQDSTHEPFVITLIVIFLIIAIVIFIVLRKKNQQRFRVLIPTSD